MPTTPNLALPYPVPTDTADVPRDIKALADRLDLVTGGAGAGLPASPVDGQQCFYVADATLGIVWQLRYRAASASAYKWEVVGGLPLYSEVAVAENTVSTVYTNLATVGPQVTVPLAGDYDVLLGGQLASSTAAGTNASMSYAIGATAAVDADRIRTSAPVTSNVWTTVCRTRRKTGLAAATTLLAKYRADSAVAVYFDQRMISAVPIRVG
jgi:hypothetical protein